MPGQRHNQPTPTSLGVGVFRCVTCHIRSWHNDEVFYVHCGNTGWKRQRIRVSTKRLLWRRKFSSRSCRDSNSQPFDHESGALTIKLPRLPESTEVSLISRHFENTAQTSRWSCTVMSALHHNKHCALQVYHRLPMGSRPKTHFAMGRKKRHEV